MLLKQTCLQRVSSCFFVFPIFDTICFLLSIKPHSCKHVYVYNFYGRKIKKHVVFLTFKRKLRVNAYMFTTYTETLGVNACVFPVASARLDLEQLSFCSFFGSHGFTADTRLD